MSPRVLSTPPFHSNGVGSSSGAPDGKQEKQVLIWKCLVLLFSKLSSAFFFFFVQASRTSSYGAFSNSAVISVSFTCVPACVCSCMYQISSGRRVHTRRRESRISSQVQPIKYNSWVLQWPWIVVITLVLACMLYIRAQNNSLHRSIDCLTSSEAWYFFFSLGRVKRRKRWMM